MVTIGLTVFSVLAGLATLWGVSLQLADRRFSRGVAQSRKFPIKIHRSISYKDYITALERLASLINERREIPDVVVFVRKQQEDATAAMASIEDAAECGERADGLVSAALGR